MKTSIDAIVYINKNLYSFWANVDGWAPDNAAELLKRSMLDWQMSLSESLYIWCKKENITDGNLILAWVNMGALLEGTMKLFLCIYKRSYDEKPHIKNIKKGTIAEPDKVQLEELKQHFSKNNLFKQHSSFFDKVQKNRNAIHAFQERRIDPLNEFSSALLMYIDFLEDVVLQIPSHDDNNLINFYDLREQYKLPSKFD